MRQYPIWNMVQACIYKQPKNWGAQKECAVEVRVGTSSSNSHTFVKHRTTHRLHDNGDREFHFYVDGQLVKRAVLRAGESELQVFDGAYPTNSKWVDVPIENGVLN